MHRNLRLARGCLKKVEASDFLQFILLYCRTIGISFSELSDIDSDEIMLHYADYLRNPWGEERADYRSGMITATIANYAGKQRKKGSKDAIAEDYMYLELIKKQNPPR